MTKSQMIYHPGRRFGDRRRGARFDITGPVAGSVDTITTLAMRNVSRGGGLLEAATPLPIGSSYKARLICDGHVSQATIPVRRLERMVLADGRHGHAIAVEFTDLPPDTVEQIDELIASATQAPEEIRGGQETLGTPERPIRERRRFPRATLSRGSVIASVSVPVQLLELSESGVLLSVANGLTVGQRGQLRAIYLSALLEVAIEVVRHAVRAGPSPVEHDRIAAAFVQTLHPMAPKVRQFLSLFMGEEPQTRH